MSQRRKANRPSTPAEIARRRAEAMSRPPPEPPAIDPSHLTLTVNAELVIRRDAAGRITRARRQDVFDMLQARGKLAPSGVDAVRRLQSDIARLHRTLGSGGDLQPRVDRSRTADGFSDSRLAAGARIDAVLERAGVASARLLAALCEPEVIEGRGIAWREVVARETGETLPDAQGAVLRAACENLAGAYGALARDRRGEGLSTH